MKSIVTPLFESDTLLFLFSPELGGREREFASFSLGMSSFSSSESSSPSGVSQPKERWRGKEGLDSKGRRRISLISVK